MTIAIIGLALVYAPSSVYAQDTAMQQSYEGVSEKIKSNCDSIKTTLRRIHTNDALLRVNIGQQYSSMSSQFMARLNSRLALNRIDSTELVGVTNQFELDRSNFSQKYVEYEAAMAGLIKTDCRNDPARFYASLLDSRDKRQELSKTVQAMNSSMNLYQVGVEHMLQNMRSGVNHED